MALPRDIYMGGAVTVNSLPYTQLYLQEQYKKQAKQEAIDNYYRDLSKGLTPTGMAANDVEDFNNKKNDWAKFTIENRAILSNPRHPKYGEVLNQENYLYNDALAHAETSKQKVKDLVQARELIKPEHPLTDASMQEMHVGGLPVARGYKPLDISMFKYQPDAFTNEDLMKLQGSIKSRYAPDKDVTNVEVLPDKKTRVVRKVSSYSPQSLSAIASDAHTFYKRDTQFKEYVDNLMKDPNAYAEANKKFKDLYGKDYNIKHGEEFAEMMLMPQKETTTETPYSYSPYSPWDYESAREKYFDYSQTQQQDKLNFTVDALVDQQIAEAAQKMDNASKSFYAEPAYLPVDPATLKSLGVANMQLSEDKQHVIPVYQYVVKDPTTKAETVVTENGTPLTIEQYKAAIGKRDVGVKYFQKKPTQEQPQQKEVKVQSKTYNYKGKKYTEEQLSKAAKASGMSVEDYKKQLGLQ